jgi:hypothetical protein
MILCNIANYVCQAAKALKMTVEYCSESFERANPPELPCKGTRMCFEHVSLQAPLVYKRLTVYTVISVDESLEPALITEYSDIYLSEGQLVFLVGAVVKDEDTSAVDFYFADWQEPSELVKVSGIGNLLSKWISKKLPLRGALDVELRQSQSLNAIVEQLNSKTDNHAPATPLTPASSVSSTNGSSTGSSRRSFRSSQRIMTPGEFGAAVGLGEFNRLSGGERGGEQGSEHGEDVDLICDSVVLQKNLTPLKDVKADQRDDLPVLCIMKNQAIVAGTVKSVDTNHGRVHITLSDSSSKLCKLVHMYVLPTTHTLYRAYLREMKEHRELANQKERAAQEESIARMVVDRMRGENAASWADANVRMTKQFSNLEKAVGAIISLHAETSKKVDSAGGAVEGEEKETEQKEPQRGRPKSRRDRCVT